MSAETENHLRAAYKRYREACDIFLKRRVHPWLGILSPRWGKVVSEVLSEQDVEHYQRLLQGYGEQKTGFGRWWYGLRFGVKQKSIHLMYQGMQTLSKPFEAGGGLGDSEARTAFRLSLQGWIGWLTPKVEPGKELLHRMTGAFWSWVRGVEKVAEAKTSIIASRDKSSATIPALAGPRLDEATTSGGGARAPSYALVKVAPSNSGLDLNALLLMPGKASEAQRIREAFNAIAKAFRDWLGEISHLLRALKSVGGRADYEKTFQEAEHKVKDFKRVMLLVYHPDKVKEVEEREVRESCFKALSELLEEAQRCFSEIERCDALEGRFEEIAYYRATVEASRACLSTMMLGRETGDIVQSTRVLMASMVEDHLARERDEADFNAQREAELAEVRASHESTEKKLDDTETKLEVTEKRLEVTEKRLEVTEKRLEVTKKELAAVKAESRVSLDATKAELAAMTQKIAELSEFMKASQGMAASSRLRAVLISNDSSSCASPRSSVGRLVAESDGFTEEDSVRDSRGSSRRSSFFQVLPAEISESAGVELTLRQ